MLVHIVIKPITVHANVGACAEFDVMSLTETKVHEVKRTE